MSAQVIKLSTIATKKLNSFKISNGFGVIVTEEAVHVLSWDRNLEAPTVIAELPLPLDVRWSHAVATNNCIFGVEEDLVGVCSLSAQAHHFHKSLKCKNVIDLHILNENLLVVSKKKLQLVSFEMVKVCDYRADGIMAAVIFESTLAVMLPSSILILQIESERFFSLKQSFQFIEKPIDIQMDLNHLYLLYGTSIHILSAKNLEAEPVIVSVDVEIYI